MGDATFFMKIISPFIAFIVLASCGPGNTQKNTRTFKRDSSLKNLKKSANDETYFKDTLFKFEAKYTFSSTKVPLYTKKAAAPDFKNNPFAPDKEYTDFITEGCNKNGINFGGHYTIINKGCGTMCELLFIVDRISGKIFTGTKPGDGRYGFLFQKNSNLLIANSNSFQDDSLKTYFNVFGTPELYLWQGSNFERVQ